MPSTLSRVLSLAVLGLLASTLFVFTASADVSVTCLYDTRATGELDPCG